MTTRRKVLVSTAALAVGGLAGCVGDSDDGTDSTGNGNGNGNGNGDGNGTGNGTANGDEQGSLTTTIETIETDCAGGQSDSVRVDFDDEGFTVSGVTPAPTPCHDAVVESRSLDDDTFSLTVGVESDGSDTCSDCTGRVAYEARLEGGGAGGVSGGTIRHVEGETHQVTTENTSSGTGEPTIERTSVSDQSAQCRTNDSEEFARVSKSQDTLVVEGRLHTNTPCHEAVVSDVQVDGGDLSVAIDARSTLGEDEACQQCLGEVAYTVRLELSDVESLEFVRIHHPDGVVHTADGSSIQSRS